MKCKNCGIYYQDDEKECPMCGTKAGRRTSKKSSSSGLHTNRQYTAKHQTVMNGQPVKKTKPGIAIAVVVVVLLSLLQPIIGAITDSIGRLQNDWQTYTEGGTGYSALPETGDNPIDEDGFIRYPMLQGDWVIDRQDGNALKFSVDSDNYYTLSYQTERYQYTENGKIWLWLNASDNTTYYTDTYPSAQFYSYTFNLERSDMQSEGAIPAALSQNRKRDIWMLLFENKNTGDSKNYIVYDNMGEGAPVFPEESVNMYKVQGG